jgi:dUTP pyrophosphatase
LIGAFAIAGNPHWKTADARWRARLAGGMMAGGRKQVFPAMNAKQQMPSPTLGVIRLRHSRGLPLPAYQSEGAAGLDLHAACGAPIVLAPGGRAAIPTGLVLEIPQGFEGQVRPRSGLALNDGITCLNSPGTIDADYRGEVKVILANLGQQDFVVERGMRIAQLVIAPVARVGVAERAAAGSTPRGAGGFGSTGT